MATNSERATRWRKANPERAREISRRYYRSHRDCEIARKRKWKQANKDKHNASVRKAQRRRSGAINPTSETKIGICEICGKTKKLHFDHDHETGVFRGWLCVPCNPYLEWFLKHNQAINAYLQGTDNGH